MQAKLIIFLLIVMPLTAACSAFNTEVSETFNDASETLESSDLEAYSEADVPLVGDVDDASAEIAFESNAIQPQALALQATQPAMVQAAQSIQPLDFGAPAAVPQSTSLPQEPIDGGAAESTETPIDQPITQDYGVNPFVEADQDNLSTFAMDVDTASYTLARNYLLQYNQIPPPEAIRPEEFINYFPTNYAAPQDEANAFAIHMDAAPSPFNSGESLLMRVGLQGRIVAPEDRDPALLIFVIDTSGSMDAENRLGLVKESLAILTEQLREDDRVGIVIYENTARVVLEPTPASEKDQILNAIDSLISEGSTYAEAGLSLGYQMAQAHMREDQITRVILLSDGVANVGQTGPDQILSTINDGVEAGITLSTIGVGMGNFNDVLMEQLANDGNGNYHYVDNVREARRVFVNNLTSTLQVIAYDAKIQVEFNPDVVAEYRLIGYENRAIADEDFRNDTVDAGEVGAGHTVTALYEVILRDDTNGDNLATAFVRYEDADSREVVEINSTLGVEDVIASFDNAPSDFRLLASVAQMSDLLRHSPYAQNTTFEQIAALLQSFTGNDVNIAEVYDMLQAADRLQ